jgi:hypothetical protein
VSAIALKRTSSKQPPFIWRAGPPPASRNQSPTFRHAAADYTRTPVSGRKAPNRAARQNARTPVDNARYEPTNINQYSLARLDYADIWWKIPQSWRFFVRGLSNPARLARRLENNIDDPKFKMPPIVEMHEGRRAEMIAKGATKLPAPIKAVTAPAPGGKAAAAARGFAAAARTLLASTASAASGGIRMVPVRHGNRLVWYDQFGNMRFECGL